jgi:hypothetical protein
MQEADIGASAANSHFVRVADLNTSIMLQQRINVCFGEAASQRAGPTRAVILGRSRDFAKYAFCAKRPSRHIAASSYLDTEPPFSAIANSHLTNAPFCRMLECRLYGAKLHVDE